MATTKSSTDRCCPNQLTPSKILKKEIHKIHISSPPPPAKRSLASSTRITTNTIHRKDDPSSSSLSPYVVNNNGEEDAASSDGGWFHFKTTVNSLEYSATSFCTPSYSNPVCVPDLQRLLNTYLYGNEFAKHVNGICDSWNKAQQQKLGFGGTLNVEMYIRILGLVPERRPQHLFYGRGVLYMEGVWKTFKQWYEKTAIPRSVYCKPGDTFMVALVYGVYEIAEYILNSNQKDSNKIINTIDKHFGHTPLINASMSGNVECLDLLIKWNAVTEDDTGNNGENADQAFNVNLINHRNRKGLTALIIASQKGNTEFVRKLLHANGLKVNESSIGFSGSAGLWTERINGFMSRNVGRVERKGHTALMEACKNGHSDCVSLLLTHKDIDINASNYVKNNALLIATRARYRKCVAALCDGAGTKLNVNAADQYGDTPLMIASRKGYSEIVEILLGNENIDVNAHDIVRKTALLKAAEFGHHECLTLLLEFADTSENGILLEGGGFSAIELAQRNNHDACVELLTEYNANHENFNINVDGDDEDGEHMVAPPGGVV